MSLLLTRLEEGGVRDFLRQQNIPIVVRANLCCVTPTEQRGGLQFARSEKQFLSTFKGTRMKNAALDGLPEAPWRYEALYPNPLGEQYVVVVQDINDHSIEHVSLLESGGSAWSGLHIDSNPEGSVVSQLDSGRKLWEKTVQIFLRCGSL